MSGRRISHGEEWLWVAPVALTSLLLFAFAQLFGMGHGIFATAMLGDYGYKALRALPLLAFVTAMALLLPALLSRDQRPLQRVMTPLKRQFGSPSLTAAALSPLLLMPLLFAGYGVFKMLIPLHVPFSWDDNFARMDRFLFAGYQPWELTHALFGGEFATRFIDRLYTLWVVLLSFAILAFALFAPRYDRARFFLAFTGAWVVGLASAYLLSSAGPCYAALVGASTAPEFAPLMERLTAHGSSGAPLGAVHWQEVLWTAYADEKHGFGMGISAMPSLHNAIAVLYALALARFGRVAGMVGILFALVTFVGSVHLGWHYAVDGIVAAFGMWGIWSAAGRYLERSGYAEAVKEPVAEAPTDELTPAIA